LLFYATSTAQSNVSERLILAQKEQEKTVKFIFEKTTFLTVIQHFYTQFISSQDGPSCNFELSCSHFALKAIEEKGFFLGYMLTYDRLMRCSINNEGEYEINEQGLFIEPIDY